MLFKCFLNCSSLWPWPLQWATCSSARPPSGKEPLPNTHLTLPWHSSMPYPPVLLLSPEREATEASSQPFLLWAEQTKRPLLLLRRLSHFHSPLQDLSNSFMYFLYHDAQNYTQCLRWGHTVQSKGHNVFPYPAGSAEPAAPQPCHTRLNRTLLLLTLLTGKF